MLLQTRDVVEVRCSQIRAVLRVVHDSESKTVLISALICVLFEASHCRVGRKPAACQVEPFKHAPSIPQSSSAVLRVNAGARRLQSLTT